MISFSLAAMAVVLVMSCNDNSSRYAQTSPDSAAVGSRSASTGITTENVTVSADTTNMQCFIAYDAGKSGKRPIVLILPEWWGLNDYPKARARQLAELGYFAMAIDLYGNGRVGANPDQAKALAGPYYGNPQLSTSRILAALAKAKSYGEADSTKTAAIGYCFGGTMVLNAARLGAPLSAVVSFHGGLAGVTPKKNAIQSKILVCHGMADKFVSAGEVAAFKKQLDSVGAPFTFKEYPNATHAFTNPGSDENAAKFKMPIAYNPEADKKSWQDMQDFFATVLK